MKKQIVKASYSKYSLNFRKAVKTSRDTLSVKEGYFLKLQKDNITAVGECSFIKKLSCDIMEDYEEKLAYLCDNISDNKRVDLSDYPSQQFALETAIRDFHNGGKKIIFKNDFYKGKKGIPINGLIWMSDFSQMKKELKQKLEEGYSCIKIKVGQHDFDDELTFVKKTRKEYPDITIRLDANGAFRASEAAEKIKRLSETNIHSLEQPLKAGLWEEMAKLCEQSPIDIALDEELIGIKNRAEKIKLLDSIKAHYLILKPSLLGGFEQCDEWIRLAEERNIDWWATSALESNIGLNAIAQWLCEKDIKTQQGLGTGLLYSNNIVSPLIIKKATLYYDNSLQWDPC